MTDLELIGKQQLEIVNLKERLTSSQDALRFIVQQITCIGGPLNDNKGQYTRNQLMPFHDILSRAEHAIERGNDD